MELEDADFIKMVEELRLDYDELDLKEVENEERATRALQAKHENTSSHSIALRGKSRRPRTAQEFPVLQNAFQRKEVLESRLRHGMS